MKTLCLILLALGLSYTSPRAQVGVITRTRNGRVVSTQVLPGTRIRTQTYNPLTQTYTTRVYGRRFYRERRDRSFNNGTVYSTPGVTITTPGYYNNYNNNGILNARLHGGVAHAYGLRHRYARMMRER